MHTAPTHEGIPHTAQALFDFWRDAGPTHWFAKNADFDATFRSRFYDAHYAAARQELGGWLDHPVSALALVILLDQYPRNAFRGTGHMFATDGLALHCARLGLHWLDEIPENLKNFMCLPFMHSEQLAVQEEALRLYAAQVPGSMSWAQEHHDIIARFGRFPHRNAALGRTTTAEEQAYLEADGFAG